MLPKVGVEPARRIESAGRLNREFPYSPLAEPYLGSDIGFVHALALNASRIARSTASMTSKTLSPAEVHKLRRKILSALPSDNPDEVRDLFVLPLEDMPPPDGPRSGS